MVSLSDNVRRSNSSGGCFFGESENIADTDELIIDDECDNLYGLQPFRPIKVPPYIVLLIIVVVCLGLSTLLIPLPWISSHMGIVSPLIPLIACHSFAWCFTACVQYILHKQHKLSRTSGYLELYRNTATLRRAPLIILSGGSICLLITISVVDTLCLGEPSHFNCHRDWPTRLIYYVEALLLTEVLIVLINLSIYLRRTLKFNKCKPEIDANQNGFLSSSNNIDDIGIRDEIDSDDLVEKQADLIRYLKMHNRYLSKKIFQLTNESSATSNDNPPPPPPATSSQ